ncbi:DsrE family protein [Emticicia sp. W12TSBA100-4]|uniref:DsrE family protein n=1 Tax=Emticicia sp. W12TSBA100-4 TaxID=3160965 RepID=UPI0033067B80
MKAFNLLLFAFLIIASTEVFAQKHKKNKEHQVVFHLSTPDTVAYRALTKQLSNVLSVWPTAKIEVVIHNKGLGMVLKGKSQFEPEINNLIGQGVSFVVCENSLKQQKLTKEQIFSKAGFVPAGLVEIIEKQEQGWSYIKAGF